MIVKKFSKGTKLFELANRIWDKDMVSYKGATDADCIEFWRLVFEEFPCGTPLHVYENTEDHISIKRFADLPYIGMSFEEFKKRRGWN